MAFEVFAIILSALTSVLSLLVPGVLRLIPQKMQVKVTEGHETYTLQPRPGKEGVLQLAKLQALHADRIKFALEFAFNENEGRPPLDQQIINAQQSMMKSLNALDNLLQGWPGPKPEPCSEKPTV